VPAQVGGVSRYNDDVGYPGPDLLLAARAYVGFAGLRTMYPADIEAQWFPGGGEIGDLL
jgi:hypothetical protein